ELDVLDRSLELVARADLHDAHLIASIPHHRRRGSRAGTVPMDGCAPVARRDRTLQAGAGPLVVVRLDGIGRAPAAVSVELAPGGDAGGRATAWRSASGEPLDVGPQGVDVELQTFAPRDVDRTLRHGGDADIEPAGVALEDLERPVVRVD